MVLRYGIIKDMDKIIVYNAIRCKHCGDEIESNFTHDFKTCKCGRVSVDGGHDYFKRDGAREDYEELDASE